MNNLYQKNSIPHSLYSIYVENLYDDDLFYHSENEDLTIIRDSNLLKPFIPFSKDSDRGFNSAFYSSNDDNGIIIIDCSYTKFFLEIGSQGTPIYIQNIIS
jgi:hypothetical protein